MGSLKKIVMAPVYWAIGWVAATWGEWMYSAMTLDLDFDEEDMA